MKKITNADYKELSTSKDELDSIIEDYQLFSDSLAEAINELINSHKSPSGKTLEELNEELDNCKDTLTENLQECKAKIEDYVSERSDRWHESEKAEEYTSWIDCFESLESELYDIETDLEFGSEYSNQISVSLTWDVDDMAELPPQYLEEVDC